LKKLIVKTLILLVVIVGITETFVSILVLPDYMDLDPCRFQYISKRYSDYNVYFIGSSRFGRQLDPILFDSLNRDLHIRSYNLSFDDAKAPITLNIAEELLALPELEMRLMILELTTLDQPKNLSEVLFNRRRNWYTIEDFSFIMHELQLYGADVLTTLKICGLHHMQLAHRIINVGVFWNKFKLAANDCMDNSRTINSFEKQRHFDSNFEQKVNQIAKANLPRNLDSYNLDLTRSAYHKRIMRLKNLCRKKGIQLVLVVAPKMEENAIRYVQSLARTFDQNMVIELHNAETYSKFYELIYSADSEHINKNAVPAYTAEMSKKLRPFLLQE